MGRPGESSSNELLTTREAASVAALITSPRRSPPDSARGTPCGAKQKGGPRAKAALNLDTLVARLRDSLLG